MSSRKIIYADEFGDPSSGYELKQRGSYEPSRVFGYGIAVPSNDSEFRQIRVKLGELDDVREILSHKKRKELKSRRLPPDKQMWVADRIGECSVSYAFVVDKANSHPQGWDEYDSVERMLALALYSVEQVIQTLNECFIEAVFDDHTAYHNPWVNEVIRSKQTEFYSKFGKTVTIIFAKSSSGDFTNPLQTVDMVAFATLLNQERGQHDLSGRTRVEIALLDGNDSVKQTQLKSKNRRREVFPPRYGYYSIVTVV